MHLLKLEMLHSKTEQSSPEPRPQKSHSLFTPFQKQRDSMNRLIKRQPLLKHQSTEFQPFSKAQKDLQKLKEVAMNKKILECFKHQNVFDDCCQPKKRKIGKKTIIQILNGQNSKKRPSTQHLSRQKCQFRDSESSQMNRFGKTHSEQLNKNRQTFEFGIKRMNSSIISRPVTSSTSAKKMNKNSPESPKKVLYYQPKINIQENMDKYPEMIRHRRLREMQVKLNHDFEQTHNKFLGKMMESKQLAFEVKLNLDKIDGYF